MAVEPSLMASREYSTWKRRPSGEKVLWGLAGADGVGWVDVLDTAVWEVLALPSEPWRGERANRILSVQ